MMHKLLLASHFLILIVLPFQNTTAQTIEPETPKPAILSSEAPALRFENLSLKDGMAQYTAESVLQDSLGYVWIATQGGLHRYNGYEFEIYSFAPFDTTSLSVSYTSALDEASNGDLWVGTTGGGLNRFNRKNQNFTTYVHDPSDSTTISSNFIEDVYEATNGDLWVTSSSITGVSRLPADSTDYFIRYQHDPEDINSLSSDNTLRISEDASGNIWIGMRQGINRINPETGEISRFLEPKEDSLAVSFIVSGQYHPPESPDIVWLTTSNGIVKLNSATGDYIRYLPEDTTGNEPSPLPLWDISPDPENPAIFWAVGLNTGLVRFDTQTNEYIFYQHDPGDPNSIINNTATNITADRTGKLWIGHSADGVSLFTPSSGNFLHIRHDPQDPQSLGPDAVWGLYEDQNQTLWAGTGNSTEFYLNRINLETGGVTRYEHEQNNLQSITDRQTFVITEDRFDRFWVGTARGLNLFNRQTETATRFIREPLVENLASNFISSVVPKAGSENELWIGAYNGLKLLNVDNGNFTDVPIRGENFDNPPISHLFYDLEGRLWAGSLEGLIQVATESGDHTIYRYNPSDTTSLSSNSIIVMTQRESENGILWVGTKDGGLNRLDIESGEAVHFTTDDGLADNAIYGILEDDRGTLWMSTNRGISNFNPDHNAFRNYGLEDGLIQLEYNQFAFAKGANGILYFGHLDGITAFNPENINTNSIPPQVVISDFRLFNETVLPGPDKPFDEQIEKESEITIGYNQGEIAFEYVGLHYSNPSKNQYKYRLVGFDENWVEAGSRRLATYTNLAPGEYTFNIQASNADGVWNEEGAKIKLTILPPWYRTGWAYGGFALILACIIFGVDRIQRRRLALKEQERATLLKAELRAEEENKRRADTEQLSKIGRTITSTLSVDEIIYTTYQNVNELMDAEIFGVGIFNMEKNRLEFPGTTEKGIRLKPYSHDLDDDSRLSAWCFNHQNKIVIGDFENEYDEYVSKIVAPIRGDNPKSIIYLPLVHNGETIGVLTTQSFTKHAYSEYHVTLLQNLANYTSIALDNASAYRRLNRTLEDLQSVQTQLIQQEKLASLGQLTAGIAHEIQNPLNFVNNFSDLSAEMIQELVEIMKNGNLKEAEDLANDISKNLNKIHEHGTRAEGIVKSMLQHSRGGKGTMEPTPLNPLIKEFVNLAYHGMRARKNPMDVEIKLELDENVGEVDLIAEDFSRVILNLCNNAFDAMSEKLGTANNEPNSEEYLPSLVVRTQKKDQSVTIQIQDNGPGIPEEMKDKILQPFFTTKKGTAGTGLGLSISNDIIKAHGGQLDIHSEKEEFTRFTITLNY